MTLIYQFINSLHPSLYLSLYLLLYLPFLDDDNRVLLQNEDHDYINASPVSYKVDDRTLRYIACQGPKEVKEDGGTLEVVRIYE